MDDQVPVAEYEKIRASIRDDTTPVGIDAVKTHIIIIHKLNELERRDYACRRCLSLHPTVGHQDVHGATFRRDAYDVPERSPRPARDDTDHARQLG